MGFLSSLFRIAAPIVGNILAPGIGGVIGGALGGAAGGGGVKGAVKGAALSYGASSLFSAAGGIEGVGGGGDTVGGFGGAGGETVAGGVGGAGGSAGTIPAAISGAGDPIEAMHIAMQSTGAETATEAANKLGYNSMQEMLSAANPNWASVSGMATDSQGGGPQSNFSGAPFDSGGNPTSYAGPGTPGAPAIAPPGGPESWLDILRRNATKLSPLVTGINVASGAMGLYNAAQTYKLGAAGRGANKQLEYLNANPNAIRSLPGYQSGADAMNLQLNRTLAAQGQTGGGLAAEANARAMGTYDLNFRQAEMQRLQQTAAGALPAQVQANDIVRKSLEQISYAFRRA